MAKQIAWLCCPVVGTFDQITFYKLGDGYYARLKSSLTSERVKTAPEFRITMHYADMLIVASRIGSYIYKAMPPGWRQFWMYRGYTGEAFTMLKESISVGEIKQILWDRYVAHWEQKKAADPDNPIFQPKVKIRKPRKYSDESIQRMLKRKDKNGKRKWRDPEEEEQKRLRKERNDACYKRTMEKWGQAERARSASLTALQRKPGVLSNKIQPDKVLNPMPHIHYSAWLITADGKLRWEVDVGKMPKMLDLNSF